MKPANHLILAAAALVATTTAARAQQAAGAARPRPAGSVAGELQPGAQPERIGIGVAIGHPTGLVLRVPLGDRLAVQAGLGSGVLGGTGLHVHADVVARVAQLTATAALYVGGGLRVWGHRYDPVSRYDQGRDTHVGLRVPVGITIAPPDSSLSFFGELGLVADLAGDDGCLDSAPSTIYCTGDEQIDALLSIGVRFHVGGAR